MPDKRLIDAKALDEALREEYLSAVEQSSVLTARGSIIFNAVLDRVRCMVMSAPTIDAVSVVHGRWILERIYRKCSLCEWIFCIRDEEGDLQKFNYCPNCGMPMDGGADNG